VSRGPYAKVAARNAELLERLRALKADHPFWGYRRIWAYLRYVDSLTVNQKRVYGVMKAADLLVKPNLKLRARRKVDTKKPRPDRPNQWWGIDMTKVMIDGFGWVYLVVVLDWHTKKVVGHYAGLQARAWHWLVALNRAVNRQFPDGIEGRSVNLMADNGCQPTAVAFMRACAALGVRQAFTSYNNPKGNADTERFLRTLKEELVWLHDWTSPATFFAALERWITDLYEVAGVKLLRSLARLAPIGSRAGAAVRREPCARCASTCIRSRRILRPRSRFTTPTVAAPDDPTTTRRSSSVICKPGRIRRPRRRSLPPKFVLSARSRRHRLEARRARQNATERWPASAPWRRSRPCGRARLDRRSCDDTTWRARLPVDVEARSTRSRPTGPAPVCCQPC
jgi:putative transposase